MPLHKGSLPKFRSLYPRLYFTGCRYFWSTNPEILQRLRRLHQMFFGRYFPIQGFHCRINNTNHEYKSYIVSLVVSRGIFNCYLRTGDNTYFMCYSLTTPFWGTISNIFKQWFQLLHRWFGLLWWKYMSIGSVCGKTFEIMALKMSILSKIIIALLVRSTTNTVLLTIILRERLRFIQKDASYTGRARLIRSHLSARISFKWSGNSN